MLEDEQVAAEVQMTLSRICPFDAPRKHPMQAAILAGVMNFLSAYGVKDLEQDTLAALKIRLDRR